MSYPQVAIKCASPDDIVVEVSITATLGQLRRIAEILTDNIAFYAPLVDIRLAALRAISELDQRDVIRPKPEGGA